MEIGDKESMELGPQPLDTILSDLDLSNHDLAAASTEQLTHKQVQKGRKGRRLTRNIQMKILRALNSTAGKDREQAFELGELFNYRGK